MGRTSIANTRWALFKLRLLRHDHLKSLTLTFISTSVIWGFASAQCTAVDFFLLTIIFDPDLNLK